MQSYQDIPDTTSLTASRAPLLNNILTALSNSSGTVFPTANLWAGMSCYRTDQGKLYTLLDLTPTWSLDRDFNYTALGQGADIGGAVDLNTMITTGWYAQTSDANVATGANYPSIYSGLLKVHASGAMVYQSYYVYFPTAPALYFRTKYSTTWSAWQKVWTAPTVDYSLLSGVVPTWNQNTTGSAATAGTASTANALNTANSYQGNALGVGTPASATAGEIRATNNITAYYSDERLKTVSGNIENALNAVCSLNGVIYKSNETAAKYGYVSDEEQVGVLAQELARVLPQVVTPAPFDIGQREDGSEYSLSGEDYMTVRYERIVPLLIEAIKELSSTVNALKAEMATLSELKPRAGAA